MKLIVKNIEFLEAVCWDYDINSNDVYTILKTKKDDDLPISFDVLRKKVLKYVSIIKLQEIFTLEELKDIFSNKTIVCKVHDIKIEVSKADGLF